MWNAWNLLFFSWACRACAFFVIKDVRRMVGRGGKKAENRGEREREERKLGEIADLT